MAAAEIQIGRIVVGDVSPRFDACERADRTVAIDVAAARAQHEAYRATLAATGARLMRVAASDDDADCVFVEDTAVVIDSEAVVLTRPGAASRRGEIASIAACLPAEMKRYRLRAPATLDGGDLLRWRDRLWVGLTGRTNRAGAAELARIASGHGLECSAVEVPVGLHLKSACSLADADTLLYDPAVGLDLAPFRAAGLELVAAPEPAGANVLALAGGAVLVSAAAPATAELLAARGADVTVLAMTEVHKADGALTCCSIRIPPSGGWCT
jgi:dimethylargininase